MIYCDNTKGRCRLTHEWMSDQEQKEDVVSHTTRSWLKQIMTIIFTSIIIPY